MFGLASFGGAAFGDVPLLGLYFVSTVEAASALDAESSLAALIAAMAEAGSASDAQSGLTVYPVSIDEIQSALDGAGSLAIYPSSVADALSAIETQAVRSSMRSHSRRSRAAPASSLSEPRHSST